MGLPRLDHQRQSERDGDLGSLHTGREDQVVVRALSTVVYETLNCSISSFSCFDSILTAVAMEESITRE